MQASQEQFYTQLENRQLIHVSGADARDFLQGLLTNDVDSLQTQDMIYACLLTPQGKFLFEFFVQKHTSSEDGDGFILDCERHETQAILKKLKLYKIRKKVTIEALDDTYVYAIKMQSADADNIHNVRYATDPRHKDAGFRIFCLNNTEKDYLLETCEKAGVIEAPFDAYDMLRLRLGLPDGSRDMVPESTTMAEARLDVLNGVSFNKGCYVGQELTARMHNRGLAKKHILPIEKKSLSESFPEPRDQIIDENGKTIGEMRSSCGAFGLALIRERDSANWNQHKRFKLTIS